jgi:hypothetical protein
VVVGVGMGFVAVGSVDHWPENDFAVENAMGVELDVDFDHGEGPFLDSSWH